MLAGDGRYPEFTDAYAWEILRPALITFLIAAAITAPLWISYVVNGVRTLYLWISGALLPVISDKVQNFVWTLQNYYNGAHHIFDNVEHKFVEIWGDDILTNPSFRIEKLNELGQIATDYVNKNGGINNVNKVYSLDMGNQIVVNINGRIVEIQGYVQKIGDDIVFRLGNAWVK